MVRPAPRPKPSKPKRAPEPERPSSSEFIGSITALKKQTQVDEALDLLHKIATYVSPVMRARGFKVGQLCEFFPKDPYLLGVNVNRGMVIRIRLRPHNHPTSFLPFESLLGTMLHELTHNLRGPHDQQFYSLLDEMVREMEDLMVQGFTGEHIHHRGFARGGIAVGGSAKASTPAEARPRAAAAAETRTKLFANSGQRLGGSAPASGLSLREQVRLAAERRAADSKWCGSQREGDPGIEEAGDDELVEIDVKEWEKIAKRQGKRARSGSMESSPESSATSKIASSSKLASKLARANDKPPLASVPIIIKSEFVIDLTED